MANQNELVYTEIAELATDHARRKQRVQLLESELKSEKDIFTEVQKTILKHLQVLDKKSLAVYIEGTGNIMLYYRDTHGIEEQLRVEGPIELLG